jgi:hypothetical protein
LNLRNIILVKINILDESSTQLGAYDEGQGLENRSCEEQAGAKPGEVFKAQIKRCEWETAKQQETS